MQVSTDGCVEVNGEVYGFSLEHGQRGKYGCVARIEGQVCIFVWEYGKPWQNWELAHKLGHVVLGHADEGYVVPEYGSRRWAAAEAAADWIASEILIPHQYIQYADKVTWEMSIEYGKRFKVPPLYAKARALWLDRYRKSPLEHKHIREIIFPRQMPGISLKRWRSEEVENDPRRTMGDPRFEGVVCLTK